MALNLLGVAMPDALQGVRHGWHQLVTRPNPRPAGQIQQIALVQTLLINFTFLGMPVPPPPPGSDFSETRKSAKVAKTVVLSDVTTRFCQEDTAELSVDTSCESSLLNVLRHVPSFRIQAPKTLIHDLYLANQLDRALSDPHLEHVNFQPAKELERVDWTTFYERFPAVSGTLTLSQAVISKDGQSALIYSSLHCGPLCGSGKLHVFRCVGRSWSLERTIHVWSS